ncbi:major facilitator superfamily transporter [Colletotrichum higginsianum]|nr:major facilitator superfamily transporter [Colletotrichum higginsianum]
MASTQDVDNAVAPGDDVTGGNNVVLVQDEKKSSGKVGEQVDILEAEPQKAYYSSVSVWLMVLFSGLAIGLSNAFLIGMIVGMILFGVVSDQLGRKTGAIATTILLVLGISLSTAANGTTTTGMFWMLIIARGIAGVGAGGEYPVSGAGAAEATDEDAKFRKRRGFMFAMLADLSASLGYVWGGLVPLLLLLCVGQQVSKYHIVWRTSFALGMAPPLLIFWFRMRMAVSTAYRKSALRKQRVPYKLALKRYWRPLLGAASTWFLYNWISIPFGIFSSTIISRANVENSLVKTLGWGVVINCFYIPGPFIGGYLSDKIGRRQTMALGFTLQAILGFVLGGAMDPIQRIFPLFVVLYGIFLTLGEVGPGRYTADPSKGNQVAFLIGSGFAVLGAIIALFVIPDTSRHLNDDDDAWKKYLEDNGWDAFWGDEVSQDPSGVVMNKAVS